uniref:Uncharacterized protein n=1 Tax=Oncorhynchus kisutch TaxID=8019 RepID=A0A8C7HRP1_ONCKI
MFVPGLVSYKGLKLIKNLHYECYLHTLKDFEIWDSDIFAVTYPKSEYFTSVKMSILVKTNTMEIVPWIEVEMKTVDYGSMPSPRLFASHLLPNLLNPKDVACSFYHFHNENFDILFLTYEEMKKKIRVCILIQNTFFVYSFFLFSNMRQTPKCQFGYSGSCIPLVASQKQFSITQSERFDTIYKEGMKGFPLEFLWDL